MRTYDSTGIFALTRPAHVDLVTIVDFETAVVRLGRSEVLARAWEAQCVDARALYDEAALAR
jgi:magnesium chelatase subunit ChlD-like protein